jgi:hypothetical protein
MILAALASLVVATGTGCGGGSSTKTVSSSTAASQGSIDELTARVQRDEMLNAWVTISAMPLHDLDATLQGGKIDGKYVPTLRTLIRVLALTGWSSDVQQFTTKMHDDAVALFQALNAGKEASAIKDLSSAVHQDGDAFGSVVGSSVARGLPADAGGPQAMATPGGAAAATSAAATTTH